MTVMDRRPNEYLSKLNKSYIKERGITTGNSF